MKCRLPPFATSKSLTQEPWGEVRENPGKQQHPEHWDSGQQGIWESRMFCIPSEEPPSSSTPSTRPENSGAVPGTLHCSWCLLHAHRRNLLPFWHLGRSKLLQGVHRALHMQRTPGNTELGSGSLVPGRKAKGQAFASPRKYLHGVFVTAGTEWQPRCEQQCP